MLNETEKLVYRWNFFIQVEKDLEEILALLPPGLEDSKTLSEYAEIDGDGDWILPFRRLIETSVVPTQVHLRFEEGFFLINCLWCKTFIPNLPPSQLAPKDFEILLKHHLGGFESLVAEISRTPSIGELKTILKFMKMLREILLIA
jgi:hypothetical protein